MSKLAVFDYNSNSVRIIEQNGEPWFVAKDLCQILGIANSRDALTRLDEDEKSSVALTDGTPGNPNTAIVSESGMYALVLSSRKPGAKPFRKWVTSEVLPSIRKTGQSDLMDIFGDSFNTKGRRDNSGFIYLAQASQTQWCKIGMSKQPYKRMQSLQTGSPLEIILIHRIYTFDAIALEKSLHEYFDAYRVRGEWFDLPAECIQEFPIIANQLDAAIEQVCLPQ